MTRADGMSLVEVLVALLIFSIVAFGLAAGTLATLRAITFSESVTGRAMAVRSAEEALRAAPGDQIDTVCSDGPIRVGDFAVNCSVTELTPALMEVRLITVGPGVVEGRVQPGRRDTSTILLARSGA